MLCSLLAQAQRVPCRNAQPFAWNRDHFWETRQKVTLIPLQPVGVLWSPKDTNTNTGQPGNGLVGIKTNNASSFAGEGLIAEPVANGKSALLWLSAQIASTDNQAAVSPTSVRWHPVLNGAPLGLVNMFVGGTAAGFARATEQVTDKTASQSSELFADGMFPIPLNLQSQDVLEIAISTADETLNSRQFAVVRLSAVGWWWIGESDRCRCGC